MKQKASKLFTEDTSVPPSKSLNDITALLISANARSITTEHDKGVISGVAFTMPTEGACLPYRLPLRVDPVFRYLQARRNNSRGRRIYEKLDREKAERVAWRQLYWWLKSQLTVIELGMVETHEVLMPYRLGPDGRTFFDTYRGRLLEAGSSAQGEHA